MCTAVFVISRVHGRGRGPARISSRSHPRLSEGDGRSCPAQGRQRAKNQGVEYLSFGLPCVSTSLGVAGLNGSRDPPFLVSDDEESFAGFTVKLCRDSAFLTELQRRTESYLHHYGPDSVFSELDACLNGKRGTVRSASPSRLS